ncbi:hypothetical protein L3Q82_017375, partial [Scortum barcoo]
FPSEEKDFELDLSWDRELVEVLEDRGDVVTGEGGIAVKRKTMSAYDDCQGDVEDKQKRTKHQTPWDALGQRRGGGVVADAGKLLSFVGYDFIQEEAVPVMPKVQ